MGEEEREIRVRIEAPGADSSALEPEKKKTFSWFYWILLFLTVLFSVSSLYLAFLAWRNFPA